VTRRGGSSTSPEAAAPGAEAQPEVLAGPGAEDERPRSPRLARHTLTLDDGHRVGVAVCGQGIPTVLVHGFTAEGILYAQTLNRLVRMGFKVVAIDVAGHGATQGLPTGGGNLAEYARLLTRILDHLGIDRSLLVGHSLGGRLVTEVAAQDPDRAAALMLIDACVGATWDRLIDASLFVPPLLGGVAAALVVDTVSTLQVLTNRQQAMKLGRLVGPTLVNHARRPWRMLGPAVSLVRSSSSRPLLDALAAAQVPVVVVHGDRDLVVPYWTATDTARATHGWLVTVHGGTHSWVLKDPETLPAIVAHLIQGPLAGTRRRILQDKGLDPETATPEEVEDAFLPPDARVRDLSPPWTPPALPPPPREPRYRWTISDAFVTPGDEGGQTRRRAARAIRPAK
jgi:pimeloyl-ACP methyl ester carboxylesterase